MMKPRYIAGLILILFGLGFLFDQFDIVGFSDVIGSWWPIIIVLIGVYYLSDGRHRLFHGSFMLILGLSLLASTLHVLPGGFWGTFWPLMIIFFGLWLLTSKFSHSNKKNVDTEYLDMVSIFGGSSDKVTSGQFKGGSVTVIFGGGELDLRQAVINPSDKAIIDITVAFGGLEIIVPTNWRISHSGMPIFGGFENKTLQNPVEEIDAPVLNINFTIAFGGVEIRNRSKKDFHII